MLELNARGCRLCAGLTRRGFLKLGGLGLGGLSLPAILRARQAQAAAKRRDTAVILYWMAGGPSHIDTYDPKPSAPAEVRGPFRAAPTRAPGISLCELLPCQARLADKFSIVRSLRHTNADHRDASHWVQTGYHQFGVAGRGQPNPAQGAVVSRLRGANRPGMPPYVCLPQSYSPKLGFFQQAGYLGSQHNPINGGGDPPYRGVRTEPEFTLPPEVVVPRLHDRRELLRHLDGLARDMSPVLASVDQSYQQAFEMITSPGVKRAFDLTLEPVAVREKFGRHPWGQAALLARRLVENGVTFVTINHYEADIDWWDDHYQIETNLRKRLPPFDQALGTLIEDLHERGLAQRVLVVACGEFGRGPRIDKEAGRGHWPRAMSALLSGGGIRTGQAIGATTSDGGEPRDRPLGPGDLLATIYRVLGIDADSTLPNPEQRPVPLVETGRPIDELF